MTRDEAIKISEDLSRRLGIVLPWRNAEFCIDAYVALGMLKLDEPKTALAKKIEKARSISSTKQADYERFAKGLELAGLKIVEKSA